MTLQRLRRPQRLRRKKYIWGAGAIGQYIDRTERQAFWLLEQGHIQGARKIGRQWVIAEEALLRVLEVEAAS